MTSRPVRSKDRVRPLCFGVRLRDKGRTVRVETRASGARRYVVEDAREDGTTRVRGHRSLQSALADAASTWRERLH